MNLDKMIERLTELKSQFGGDTELTVMLWGSTFGQSFSRPVNIAGAFNYIVPRDGLTYNYMIAGLNNEDVINRIAIQLENEFNIIGNFGLVAVPVGSQIKWHGEIITKGDLTVKPQDEEKPDGTD